MNVISIEPAEQLCSKSSGNWLILGFPTSAIVDHDVDDDEQFAHGDGQERLRRLAAHLVLPIRNDNRGPLDSKTKRGARGSAFRTF